MIDQEVQQQPINTLTVINYILTIFSSLYIIKLIFTFGELVISLSGETFDYMLGSFMSLIVTSLLYTIIIFVIIMIINIILSLINLKNNKLHSRINFYINIGLIGFVILGLSTIFLLASAL